MLYTETITRRKRDDDRGCCFLVRRLLGILGTARLSPGKIMMSRTNVAGVAQIIDAT